MNTDALACSCCKKTVIDPRILPMLVEIERRLGRCLVITSGYRCPAHNKALLKKWEEKNREWVRKGHLTPFPEAKPSKNSKHMLGIAVDLAIKSVEEATWLIPYARQVGFMGIGRGSNFVHLDLGKKRVVQHVAERIGRVVHGLGLQAFANHLGAKLFDHEWRDARKLHETKERFDPPLDVDKVPVACAFPHCLESRLAVFFDKIIKGLLFRGDHGKSTLGKGVGFFIMPALGILLGAKP